MTAKDLIEKYEKEIELIDIQIKDIKKVKVKCSNLSQLAEDCLHDKELQKYAYNQFITDLKQLEAKQ